MTNDELFREAVKASERAYSKYSGFSVGAALLTDDEKLYTGCNIENSSYSLTNCAERTAVFKAVSDGCTKFRAIAVAGSGSGDFSKPCFPCGACLQVLSEFCGDEFTVVLSDGAYKLSDFLPMRFSEESMK
ncbi:cytidine deaminase [Ruminococcus sp.]|uniref:cytidine deaminase n=1 Tax=Ruminococcus sp. TaxID=41978 RepID=UPI0025E78353|nr:cytidine deaminase [Ruminococcus sp.]MBQ6250931.1 cytidine deaminase [Ruminococcus sp.]MBR0511736.1 cytidine deaminase [Ruminococcus sp.]